MPRPVQFVLFLLLTLSSIPGLLASRPSQEGLAQEPKRFTIRVIRENGEPAAGAGVWLQSNSRSSQASWLKNARTFDSNLFAPLALKNLTRLVTDGEGVLRTEAEASPLRIRAQLGEQGGHCFWVEGQSTTVTLQLSQLFGLRVRARDSQGRAVVGIPVSFRMGPWDSYGGTRTDPAGVAKFRTLMKRAGESTPFPSEAILKVDGLLPSFQEQPFVSNPWPSAELDLALPEMGKVVVDLTGFALRTAIDSKLNVLGAIPGARTPNAYQRIYNARNVGTAVFEHVEVGLQIQLTVTHSGNAYKMQFAGPKTSGEEVNVSLDPRQTPVITGRIINHLGEPCSLERLNVEFARGSLHEGVVEVGHVLTDADGVFRYSPQLTRHARHFIEGSQVPWSFRLRRHEFICARNPLDCEVRFDFPAWPANADLNLGVLNLRPTPLLLSGRVINSKGQGIRGVALGLQRFVLNSELAGGGQWIPVKVDQRDMNSAADGSFTFRGLRDKALDEDLRVTAQHRIAYRTTPFLCKMGEENIELPMLKYGSIDYQLGALRTDGYVGFPVIVIVPEGPDGEDRAERVCLYEPMDKPRAWLAILPGSYTIRIEHTLHTEPLFSIPDVVIEAGKRLRLPALLPLKLDAYLNPVQVTLLQENGEPMQDPVELALFFQDGARVRTLRYPAVPVQPGVYNIPLGPSGTGHLGIRSPGWRMVSIEDLDADRIVRMARKWSVRLKLAPAVPAAVDGIDLRLIAYLRQPAQFEGYRDPRPLIVGDPYGAEGCQLFFEVPGVFHFIWQRVPNGVRIRDPLLLADGWARYPSGELRIEASDVGKTFVVHPPASMFEQDPVGPSGLVCGTGVMSAPWPMSYGR